MQLQAAMNERFNSQLIRSRAFTLLLLFNCRYYISDCNTGGVVIATGVSSSIKVGFCTAIWNTVIQFAEMVFPHVTYVSLASCVTYSIDVTSCFLHASCAIPFQKFVVFFLSVSCLALASALSCSTAVLQALTAYLKAARVRHMCQHVSYSSHVGTCQHLTINRAALF